MKKVSFLCLLFPLSAFSQLQVSPFFSDNMVLQRERPVTVWGKAAPGSNVSVVFGKQTLSAVVQKDSTWHVQFTKQKATLTPQTLIVSCDSVTKKLQNILIGDVWICSGQSNMEWPMRKEMHWRKEKQHAQQMLIRLNNPVPAGRNVFGVAFTDSLKRRLNTNDFYRWTGWQQCDSNTVKDMSAVAYYFAKAIIERENIPVGLVNLSIGGAPIETFISREALSSDSRFAKKLEGDWLENDHLPVWIRERAKENLGKNQNGSYDEPNLNHAYKPSFAFESGIKPLLRLPVKGVIWYQGESNAQEPERVDEYKDLLHLLIDDYRKQWKEWDMPFFWVQLSSIDTAGYRSHYWPEFRNEQRKLLEELLNGGMAVCTDIGSKNNVHPTDKKSVGERLARWALFKTYKENIVPSGPLPLQAKFQNGRLIVSFQYAAGLRTEDGLPLRGFSLDGLTDHPATIAGEKVVIKTTRKPAFVYYGWKPFTDGNLVNEQKLPGSTFKIPVE